MTGDANAENQKTEWKRQWRDDFLKSLCGLANAQGGTPISYRGRHCIRSGSTTQELDGRELDNFILRRLGKTWDGMIIPNIKVSDLDTSAFRIFREKALIRERLQKADWEMSDADLIYQDESHGSSITVADQIVDTIYRKYFKGMIGCEGIIRVMDYPVPRLRLLQRLLADDGAIFISIRTLMMIREAHG
jgi:predicted HTH transcriptional regulator